MKKRQEKILKCIVREYTRKARPISSKTLSEKYKFRLSPASLRSEMVKLTDAGYLSQPHTSAGRVPTEQAYRFFVNKFCKPKLSLEIEKELKEIFLGRKQEEEILREMGKFIATVSRNVSILFQKEDFFWQGLSYLLSQPEFYNIDEVIEVIESFEQLHEAIREEILDIEEGIKIYFPSGVTITWIDDKVDSFEKEKFLFKDEDLSLILGGLGTGFIGILGPTRMDYEKNIALIKKARELLTQEKK